MNKIYSILTITFCLLLASCGGQKRLSTADVADVHAQMYLKSKTPLEGYVPHTAEGKSYFIKATQEARFYPGEDSYHCMHHHGVAFESGEMAYRIYFDKKQTIDVYAKRRPQLELDAAKWYPTDEQLAAGFGDDILRVSGAIGVGACKPWNGEKMIHFDDVLCRIERIVALEPHRAVVEIVDSAWLAPDGQRYDLTTRYTIYGGHRDVLVEVFLSPLLSTLNSQLPTLCTGVMGVPVGNKQNYLVEENLVGSWGTAYPVNDTVKYGKETVGLGVYVPREYYKGNAQDKNNNLILLTLSPLSSSADQTIPTSPSSSTSSSSPSSNTSSPAGATHYACYYLVATGLKETIPAAHDQTEWESWLRRWAKSL